MDIISNILLLSLVDSCLLKNYIQMAVTFVQTIKDEKSFKGMSIEEIGQQKWIFKNSRSSRGSKKYIFFFKVKYSHNGYIHPMKNHQSLSLLELIDGADKVENMQNKDTISKILLSFSKESISLKKIHIDGADFYANYEG